MRDREYTRRGAHRNEENLKWIGFEACRCFNLDCTGNKQVEPTHQNPSHRSSRLKMPPTFTISPRLRHQTNPSATCVRLWTSFSHLHVSYLVNNVSPFDAHGSGAGKARQETHHSGGAIEKNWWYVIWKWQKSQLAHLLFCYATDRSTSPTSTL